MKYRKKPVIIEAYQTNEEKVIHTLEGDMKASVGDYIITGVNGEQYPCKPDIFQKTYDEVKTTGLTFGEAIQAVKNGERCARSNWNGKGQYIELATNISYINTKGEEINVGHNTMGNKAITFVGNQGVQLGWLASQADMLSDDWYIVK